ncbi:hypothetical protein CEXT_274521 [Caerostris extrusa]|uniref:Uncharacterized protein n=1 Tax=Caerostris extrusa TaxID=172846 RepID=A0AAV4Y767_CAEEX|nr:hypothetical protein CEXT_274521 [Caerostris extrusa]
MGSGSVDGNGFKSKGSMHKIEDSSPLLIVAPFISEPFLRSVMIDTTIDNYERRSGKNTFTYLSADFEGLSILLE